MNTIITIWLISQLIITIFCWRKVNLGEVRGDLLGLVVLQLAAPLAVLIGSFFFMCEWHAKSCHRAYKRAQLADELQERLLSYQMRKYQWVT